MQREPDGDASIHADIRLLLPGQGCVRCVGRLDDEESRLYDLAAPPNVLTRGQPQAWHEQRAGSLITINQMAVGAAVQLWLDLLAGDLRQSHWLRIGWHPGHGPQIESGPVSAGDDCPTCRFGTPGSK